MLTDYEAVKPLRRPEPPVGGAAAPAEPEPPAERDAPGAVRGGTRLRRGHALGFAGLFLFTFFLYFRPYELTESLSWLSTAPYWLALFTLVAFIPSQLALEGRPTVLTREVKLVLLLCLWALVSMPLAFSPADAWDTFANIFIKVVLMFLVLVNVVRTERRLRALWLLALAACCMTSVSAFRNYLSGTLDAEQHRVRGALEGSAVFGNANDMALFLVTMLPIAIALIFVSRNPLVKLCYAACAVLMTGGTIFTLSRGGFLGLVAAVAVLAWKLGRRNRLAVVVVLLVVVLTFVALAPGGYGERLLTIFSPGSENSAASRRDVLIRSLVVALRNPVFGVGIGNFPIVSIKNLVSHNAYTQVAAEMGLPALAMYLMLIITPLRRLRQIDHETFAERRGTHWFYLAVGLQASLIAYMVSSFFLSVAYVWHVYYLVGYVVCLHRMYEASGAARGEAGGRAERAEGAERRGAGRVPAGAGELAEGGAV